MITLYGVSQYVFEQSYQKIENDQMQTNLIRVHSVISNYNTTINIKLRDWASWDDSYIFVQNNNPEFKEINLQDLTLVNLELDVLAYINAHDEVVHSKWLDPIEKNEIPSMKLMEGIISNDNLFVKNDPNRKISGVALLENKIFFIEGLPILHSDGTGPSQGTQIFGRFLDASLLDNFRELTQLSVEFFLIDDVELPDDVRQAKNEFSRTHDAHYLLPLTDELIAGYFMLNDLAGTPIGIVKVTTPRDIHKQGISVVSFFFFASSVAIILFGLLIIILFDRVLFKRFSQLTKEVETISVSNLDNAHISIKGDNDEIAILAKQI